MSPSAPDLATAAGGPDKGPYVDRWGFVHDNPFAIPEMTQQQRAAEAEIELKWLKLTRKWKGKDHFTPKMYKKIIKQCQLGIPMSVRGHVWKMLLNTDEYKKTYAGKYKQLLIDEDYEDDIATIEQIDRDLHRTFPTHIRFQEENGLGQQALGRVLRAYSRYNPTLGYCQGMGFITALFLMMMEEEDAFWCLVKMCLPGNGTYMDTQDINRGYGMPGLFEDDLPMVWECIFVYEKLLKLYLPRLNAHLAAEDVLAGTYAPQYFITIFLYNMPFPCVLRIWDLILGSGYNTVFLSVIALMKVHEEELLKMDFDDIMQWVKLQQYSDTVFVFNSEALITQAISYMNGTPQAIKPRLLDQLREEYRQQKAAGEI